MIRKIKVTDYPRLIEIWESKWKKNKDQIKLLIQEEIKKAESLI